MYKYLRTYIEDILENVPLENWNEYQNHKFKSAKSELNLLHIWKMESGKKNA